ncbi:hypothetical protein HDV00_009046 [Rhizophlyctis rosea]|nr:hypothetical protein HDV00_009046 [Rhizophlyctis rosea]
MGVLLSVISPPPPRPTINPPRRARVIENPHLPYSVFHEAKPIDHMDNCNHNMWEQLLGCVHVIAAEHEEARRLQPATWQHIPPEIFRMIVRMSHNPERFRLLSRGMFILIRKEDFAWALAGRFLYYHLGSSREYQWTWLWALRNGHAEVLKSFGKKVPRAAQDYKNPQTMHLLRSGHLGCVDALQGIVEMCPGARKDRVLLSQVFFAAARRGHTMVIRQLLSWGVRDKNEFSSIAIVTPTDQTLADEKDYAQPAIRAAATYGHVATVSLLLDHHQYSISLLIRVLNDGISSKHVKVVELMLHQSRLTKFQPSFLMAVSLGYVDIVHIMIPYVLPWLGTCIAWKRARALVTETGKVSTSRLWLCWRGRVGRQQQRRTFQRFAPRLRREGANIR